MSEHDETSAGGFDWRGHRLPLFDHPYNDTLRNERALEIPIALDFLARGHGRVLEVGNVLGHYFTAEQLPGRLIADRHERAPGVHSLDVFDLAGEFDTIVTISTLEHVRWDEPDVARNPFGGVAALLYLRGLLAPGGSMLATWEGWHNPELDRWAYDYDESHSWVELVPGSAEWVEDWPVNPEARSLHVVEFTA